MDKKLTISLLVWLVLSILGVLLMRASQFTWSNDQMSYLDIACWGLGGSLIVLGVLAPGWLAKRNGFASESNLIKMAVVMGFPIAMKLVQNELVLGSSLPRIPFIASLLWALSSGILLGFLHIGAVIGASKK